VGCDNDLLGPGGDKIETQTSCTNGFPVDDLNANGKIGFVRGGDPVEQVLREVLCAADTRYE
jgi:hypothetical protein